MTNNNSNMSQYNIVIKSRNLSSKLGESRYFNVILTLLRCDFRYLAFFLFPSLHHIVTT